MSDRRLSDAELDVWLWGCVGQLMAHGLASAAEARDSMLRMVECEDAWRQLPLMMQNMKGAMPTICAQTEVDDLLGKPPRSGGGGVS